MEITNKINNIVVSDRLLFANLSYEYYKTNKKLYSPYKPGNVVKHHFQLKNEASASQISAVKEKLKN